MYVLVIQYLFLFSTSATSSSVENCPLTTMIRLLMTSSAQSTSSRPPITTGRRLGFTWNTHMTNPNIRLQKYLNYNQRQSSSKDSDRRIMPQISPVVQGSISQSRITQLARYLSKDITDTDTDTSDTLFIINNYQYI